MLSTLYICCSAGDAVKGPLEAWGDGPRRLGEPESNLLFALGASTLAASFFWRSESGSCPKPCEHRPGQAAGGSPSPGLVLGCRASSWAPGFLQQAGRTQTLPALLITPDFGHPRLAPLGAAAGPERRSSAGALSRHLPSNAERLLWFAIARQNKVPLLRFAGRKRSRLLKAAHRRELVVFVTGSYKES